MYTWLHRNMPGSSFVSRMLDKCLPQAMITQMVTVIYKERHFVVG